MANHCFTIDDDHKLHYYLKKDSIKADLKDDAKDLLNVCLT